MLSAYEVFCFFVFGCQYQFGRLPGKTCLQNGLLCAKWNIKRYSLSHVDILKLEFLVSIIDHMKHLCCDQMLQVHLSVFWMFEYAVWFLYRNMATLLIWYYHMVLTCWTVVRLIPRFFARAKSLWLMIFNAVVFLDFHISTFILVLSALFLCVRFNIRQSQHHWFYQRNSFFVVNCCVSYVYFTLVK